MPDLTMVRQGTRRRLGGVPGKAFFTTSNKSLGKSEPSSDGLAGMGIQ